MLFGFVLLYFFVFYSAVSPINRCTVSLPKPLDVFDPWPRSSQPLPGSIAFLWGLCLLPIFRAKFWHLSGLVGFHRLVCCRCFVLLNWGLHVAARWSEPRFNAMATSKLNMCKSTHSMDICHESQRTLQEHDVLWRKCQDLCIGT